jgi:hypothetical protein
MHAVPRVFELYAERWRLHHPDWETRLWRDDDLVALSCQDVLDRATGFKRRYDILRLEIVRQCGGVIVDMDVEPIRPLDPLLEGVNAFVGRVGSHHVGNQVLGAVPRHPFFERAIEGLRSNLEPDANSSETAGKDYLRQTLAAYPDDVTVFPVRTFYYEPSFEPPRRPDDYPDVYAVHHQLESYTAIPQVETVERRLDQFVSELGNALDMLGCGPTPDAVARPALDAAGIERLRARLGKAERRVRRALTADEHRRRAEARAMLAEREQMAIRLEESAGRRRAGRDAP